MRKPIIIGNWKMYKDKDETIDFLKKVARKAKKSDFDNGIAIPAINLGVAKQFSQNMIIAAQNCYFEKEGAFTGEISIDMLKAWDITHVIIGHSERRNIFNESDELINKKVIALLENGLTPILCCGEPLEIREQGKTKSFINNQLKKDLKGVNEVDAVNLVIAYEPIWAIGSGKTATPELAQETIHDIRALLTELYSKEVSEEIRIQYGGSVNPTNITQLLAQPDIDGALVGGASLKPDSFLDLLK